MKYIFVFFRRGTFIIFAVLSGLAGLATFRLPDTRNVPTPSSAEEVSSPKIKISCAKVAQQILPIIVQYRRLGEKKKNF